MGFSDAKTVPCPRCIFALPFLWKSGSKWSRALPGRKGCGPLELSGGVRQSARRFSAAEPAVFLCAGRKRAFPRRIHRYSRSSEGRRTRGAANQRAGGGGVLLRGRRPVARERPVRAHAGGFPRAPNPAERVSGRLPRRGAGQPHGRMPGDRVRALRPGGRPVAARRRAGDRGDQVHPAGSHLADRRRIPRPLGAGAAVRGHPLPPGAGKRRVGAPGLLPRGHDADHLLRAALRRGRAGKPDADLS